jgi:hypothetical protein
MKKILAAIVLGSVLMTSCTKDNPLDDAAARGRSTGVEDRITTAPEAVLSAFNARYSGATNIQWKKLSNGNYKAQFFLGSVKWEAIFTPAGSLVKEERY